MENVFFLNSVGRFEKNSDILVCIEKVKNTMENDEMKRKTIRNVKLISKKHDG